MATAALLMARTPREDTPDLKRILCERVANGELVAAVCQELGIHRSMPWRWTQNDPQFRDDYTRARENQAHAMAEDVILMADDESIPADSRRVRVDARKWLTSKIAPKLYGDEKHHTVDISVSGLYLTALQANQAKPAQLTAGDEIVVEPLPDDSIEDEVS